MNHFPLSPFTVVNGDEVRVAIEAKRSEFDPNIWHVSFSDEESTGFIVGQMLTETPAEIRFTDVNGIPVTFRHVVQSDAEAAGNHPFFPNYPLPVETIGAIMAGTQGPPDLYAVVDGEGGVNTLALVTNTGLFLRYGRTWHDASSNVLLGRRLVKISDLDVEAYDQADETGSQLNEGMIAAVPQAAPPVIETDTMTEPVITASSPIVAPVISSADDLPTAIEFASDDGSRRSDAGTWRSGPGRWATTTRCRGRMMGVRTYPVPEARTVRGVGKCQRVARRPGSRCALRLGVGAQDREEGERPAAGQPARRRPASPTGHARRRL